MEIIATNLHNSLELKMSWIWKSESHWINFVAIFCGYVFSSEWGTTQQTFNKRFQGFSRAENHWGKWIFSKFNLAIKTPNVNSNMNEIWIKYWKLHIENSFCSSLAVNLIIMINFLDVKMNRRLAAHHEKGRKKWAGHCHCCYFHQCGEATTSTAESESFRLPRCRHQLNVKHWWDARGKNLPTLCETRILNLLKVLRRLVPGKSNRCLSLASTYIRSPTEKRTCEF